MEGIYGQDLRTGTTSSESECHLPLHIAFERLICVSPDGNEPSHIYILPTFRRSSYIFMYIYIFKETYRKNIRSRTQYQ